MKTVTVTMFEVPVITGTTWEIVARSGSKMKATGDRPMTTMATGRSPPPLRGGWKGRLKKVTLASRWWLSFVTRVHVVVCLCDVVN